MEELHDLMDQEVDSRYFRLSKATKYRDTNTLWGLITAAAEVARVKFLKLHGPEVDRMRGRSKGG